MRIGQVDYASIALVLSCRFMFLGGENLSLMHQSFKDQLKLVVSSRSLSVTWLFVSHPMLFDIAFPHPTGCSQQNCCTSHGDGWDTSVRVDGQIG